MRDRQDGSLPESYRQLRSSFDMTDGNLRLLEDANRLLAASLARLLSPPQSAIPQGTVFAGFLPSPEFNASVARSADGYIILVNSRLYYLCTGTAHLVAASAPLVDHSGQDVPPVMDTNQASSLFAEFLSSPEVHLGQLLAIPNLPQPRHGLGNYYFFLCLDFVLAHELAHIVLGHVNEHILQLPASLPPSMRSLQKEFEADTMAISILDAAYATSSTIDARETPLQLKTMGATFFYEFCDAYIYFLESEHVGVRSGILHTHPHPAARKSHVIAHQYPKGTLPGPSSQMQAIATAVQQLYMPEVRKVTEPDLLALRGLGGALSAEDREELFKITNAGAGADGVGVIHVPTVLKWLEVDHERAQRGIALLALFYRRLGPTEGYHAGAIMAMLAMFYGGVYRGRLASEVREFEGLLFRTVPGLQKLLREGAEVLEANR